MLKQVPSASALERIGDGKPRKLWTFIRFNFPDLEMNEIEVWVIKSHGKGSENIKAKRCKVEKITEESETWF